MATERIESGRAQVASPGGSPMQQITQQQVNYQVGYSQAAQAASALAQTVDRMAQSAFAMAGEQQKQQAMIDVVNSPMTPEQIELAKNGDMSSIGVTRGSINIYDMAVAKARSFELSSAFESEAKSEIVKMLADIDNGATTSKMVADKLQSMSSGYAQSLAQIDPDAALKFTATMGVYANTVMSKAYESELKRNREKGLIRLNQSMSDSIKLLEPMLEQGFYTDKVSGETKPVEDLLAVLKKNFMDQAASFNASLEFTTSKSNEWDKAVADARVGALTKFVLSEDFTKDRLMGYDMISKGQLGRLSTIWFNMPQEDKAKVSAAFILAANQRDQLVKDNLANQKNVDTKEFIDLYTKWLGSSNPSEKKSLAGQIVGIANRGSDAVPLGTLNDLFDPDKQAPSNHQVEFNLMQGIYNGSITDPNQIWAQVRKGGINGKTAVTLLGRMMSEDRRSDSDINRHINSLSGISQTGGIVVIDKNSAQFANRQVLESQALIIKSELVAQGKPVTSQSVIDGLDKFVAQKRNNVAVSQATEALKVFEAKDWINGPITSDNLPSLKQKAGNDKRRQADVKRIEQLLKQKEGL